MAKRRSTQRRKSSRGHQMTPARRVAEKGATGFGEETTKDGD